MNENSPIPFLDLITPHRELYNELEEVFRSTLGSACFIGGRMVTEFEEEFAQFCDAKYCIGVSSGTDALRFALMAAGIGDGDIVITVPNTFIATTEAITQAGAVPAFVDIDERTYNMDPLKLREYLENECEFSQNEGQLIERESKRRVAAIIPVHLYGQMADMDAIAELAEWFGLVLIEDACQAHGAEYFSKKEGRWRKAGSIGKAAAFSFYPGKNLGACGEAGAVTTNDPSIAQAIRKLRDHGQAKKYYHDIEGYNGRLDALQAGILQVKLGYLAAWNEDRRKRAKYYNKLFRRVDAVKPPHEPRWAKAVYHLYVIRVEDRVELQRKLGEVGIGTGIHYPVPLHLQEAYSELGYESGDFPVAERVSAEILSLPMFPGIGISEQKRVATAVQAAVRQSSSHEFVLAAGGVGD